MLCIGGKRDRIKIAMVNLLGDGDKMLLVGHWRTWWTWTGATRPHGGGVGRRAHSLHDEPTRAERDDDGDGFRCKSGQCHGCGTGVNPWDGRQGQQAGENAEISTLLVLLIRHDTPAGRRQQRAPSPPFLVQIRAEQSTRGKYLGLKRAGGGGNKWYKEQLAARQVQHSMEPFYAYSIFCHATVPSCWETPRRRVRQRQ